MISSWIVSTFSGKIYKFAINTFECVTFSWHWDLCICSNHHISQNHRNWSIHNDWIFCIMKWETSWTASLSIRGKQLLKSLLVKKSDSSKIMLLAMVIQAWAIVNTIIKQLLQKNGNTTNWSKEFSENQVKLLKEWLKFQYIEFR